MRILYVGIGLVSFGLVLVSLGNGDREKGKGFISSHLRLVGPAMMGVGLVLSLVGLGVCLLCGVNKVQVEEELATREQVQVHK